MNKAYSYIRFSTPEQSKGDSLRRQVELSKKYASDNGLQLDTTLNLYDLGISAFDRSNITKGSLGVFLDLIKSGKIESGSYLLIESLDRLSRAQIFGATKLFMDIIEAGISIVTLEDKMTYCEKSINDNWGNLVVSLAIMSRASEESKTKSFRGRAAWDNKRANITKKRLTARCPYWLKPKAGDSGFEIIPERAKIVKKIFEMAKNGMGNHTITIRLNQENVPTFSSKTDGWQPSYIQKLFENKAIYGEFQMNTQRDSKIKTVSKPIENYYPAVLSIEEWTLVNNLRRSRLTSGGRKKGKHLSNLFSGLLFCGYCGGSMVMGGHAKPHKRDDGKKSKYVACSKARRGLGCKYSAWNYNKLENEILTYCHSIDFAQALGKVSTLASEAEEARKQQIAIQTELASTNSMIDAQVKAIESLSPELTPSSIVSRILELEEQKQQLEIKNAEAEKKAITIELSAKGIVNQKDAIIETIEQLNTLDGTALHDLRIRLSSQISQAVAKIALHPQGTFTSTEKQKTLRDGLKKAGYNDSKIKKYFSDLAKQEGKKHRFLTMIFHNGNVLQLTKDAVANNFYWESKEGYQGFKPDTKRLDEN